MSFPYLIGQICSQADWLTGDWHACFIDPMTGIVGVGLFGLLVGGALWTSLYFAGGGSTATPTAVCILVGSALFPILPGGMVGVATGAITIGVAAAFFQVLQKYVLNPSTT
jgi:hypothetical protein